METLLEKSLNKHDFPEKERRELAKDGEAMKDGSFSYFATLRILKDAIRSVWSGERPCRCETVD